MRDLICQIKLIDAQPGKKEDEGRDESTDTENEGIAELRMCKINSGKFGVPWAETEKVLLGIKLGDEKTREVQVWSPD